MSLTDALQSVVRISPAQRSMLDTLCGRNPLDSLDYHGLYYPYAQDRVTVDALIRKGLAEWVDEQHPGTGMAMHGLRATDLGRRS